MGTHYSLKSNGTVMLKIPCLKIHFAVEIYFIIIQGKEKAINVSTVQNL